MNDIIYCLGSIGFQVSMVLAVKSLSNQKLEKKKLMIAGIIIYALIYICFLQNLTPAYSTIISFIYMTILMKVLFNLNTKELLLYTIIMWIIGVIIDIFIMLISNFFPYACTNTIKYLGTFVVILIYLTIAYNRSIKSKIRKLKDFIFRLNFSYYTFIIVLIIYFYLGNYCITNINEKGIIILIIFIAFSFLLLTINFIIQQIQILSLKESIKFLNKNNESYIEIIDEYRIFKHNLIGNLNGIKTIATKKARILIEDLITEYNNKLKLPKDIKKIPVGISGIVYEKFYGINDNSLKFEVNNKIKNNIIEVLSARKYNLLCEALEIIINNAIEAAQTSKEKLIYMELLEESNKIIIKVINTFSGKLDIDRVGTKNYTSKDKGNGLGLFSLFTKRNINISTSIKNNKFISIISVNK